MALFIMPVQGQVVVTPIRDAIAQKPREAYKSTASNEKEWHSYRVGSRDVLRVTVWNHPQLMVSAGSAEAMGFQVQTDGSFFFPYAGKIKASGRTLDEIRIQLTKRLRAVVKTPQVSVSVLRYGSQKLYVLGAVVKPGLLALDGYPITVMEAIARSGGMTEQASGRKAYILRNGQRIEVQMAALMQSGDIKQNLVLRSGDVLHIPDNRAEKVYVLGAVKQPKSVVMAGGDLTLSEALVDVGGLDPLAADARNVYVIRKDANKTRVYHLDMQYAESLLLGEQFFMQPRDVVYVASAKVTQWNRVLGQIMPSIQSLFYLDALAR